MRHLRLWIAGILVLLLSGGGWLWLKGAQAPPIRIGILHTLSGDMALYERPLVDAVQLAVEEINQSGGLLGRRVEALIADCQPDATRCGQEAERLIGEEHVSALFGCWHSTCREAVRPVVERHRHLLFYPRQYEGMEQSPNIVYVGGAPNQRLVPTVRWALDNLGKRFYLIGTDSRFPRTANLMMAEIIETQGGQVLGERYLPQDASTALPGIVAAIDDLRRLKPDVVINTIAGDANKTFFSALAGTGLTARQLPVISNNFGETGVQAMPAGVVTGHYAVMSYFQTLPGITNQRFIAGFRQRYGAQRVTSDAMEAAYVGVKLWSQAVQEAGTDQPAQVNVAILRQSMAAPEGIVSLNKKNRHLWRNAHIGRVRQDGQFDIVWSSNAPICPEPYPTYRSSIAWEQRLRQAGLR